MEYSRKLLKDSAKDKEGKKEFAIKNVPFIKWTGVRTDTKMEIGKTTVHQEEYNVFDFDERLKAIYDDEDKLKYSPKDLVALIKSYFFLEKVQGVPNYEDEKIKIQRLIRRNVIIGYKKYRRKLGLKDVSILKFCYSWFGLIWFK